MTNRREFVRLTGAVATALSVPVPLSAQAVEDTRIATRPIPGTDEHLPVVGLGNAEAFRSGNLELSRELLDIFMQKGGAYIDTSASGRGTIGTIMHERDAHDELFLGTYLNETGDGAMRAEIKAVQAGQGGGTLDLVLTRDVSEFTAANTTYVRLKDDGLTRYIGVARSGKRHFDAIMKLMSVGRVDFVQVNYSMIEPEAAERLLPMAKDQGVAVVINRPFINGEYFSLVRGKVLPDWAAEFDCHSWAQFSLKFILAHPAVNCVLTETSNPDHAIDNLGAGIGRLPDAPTLQRMQQVMRDLL